MNIAEQLGFAFPADHRYKEVTPLPTSDPRRLYGLELEIEMIRDVERTRCDGFRITNDGSLRNNGYEYITEPMTFSNLAVGLTKFFAQNKFTDENYSERCSVHVHVNCLDLTMDQVKTVCLLYQTFEKFFFRFAGQDRDKSIFCVPWEETLITADAVAKSEKMQQWQKYTALNLLPLWAQGTIEFRHLPGTHDVEKILDWVNLIGCLFYYAQQYSYEDTEKRLTNLNTSSEYDRILLDVFREWTPLFVQEGHKIMLEEGVLNTKYLLLSKYNKKEEKKTKTAAKLETENGGVNWPPVPLDTILQELNIARERQANIQFQAPQRPVQINFIDDRELP